ncbi:sensor histidine kinase [Chloroflexota bacterium]
MRISIRLFVSYALVVIICLVAVAVSVSSIVQNYRDKLDMEQLDNISRPIITQVLVFSRGDLSTTELWLALRELAQENSVHIIFGDGQGDPVRQIPPDGTIEQQSIELKSGDLPHNISERTLGKFVTSDGQTYIYSAYPIGYLFGTQNPLDLKTIVISEPHGGTLPAWSEISLPLIWAGLITLGVSVIAVVLITRSINVPLRRVTEAAEAISKGDYDREIPVSGPKEIKGLAVGLNRMASQAKLLEQRLRYFVADVSHQLRNPLTSIRGFANAILDGTAEDRDTVQKAARVIEDESKRLTRQVDDLLELARMQSGQIQMSQESIDMKELLDHCSEIFTIQAKDKNVQLRSEVPPLPPVVGDIDRLEQVFINLIDNAIKHSPTEGEVVITGSWVTSDSVEIRVTDSGPGIDPDQLPHVFDRFYQVGGVADGTGLGLTIARETVMAHGGEIEAKSMPGKGAEFIVRLPTGSPRSPVRSA